MVCQFAGYLNRRFGKHADLSLVHHCVNSQAVVDVDEEGLPLKIFRYNYLSWVMIFFTFSSLKDSGLMNFKSAAVLQYSSNFGLVEICA